LVLRLRGGMQIFVKTLTGKTITLVRVVLLLAVVLACYVESVCPE
jgi:hypothetical protein